jgi:hypothetical protein
MRNRHPYPLPADALADYCHPQPGHALYLPARYEREILAANGYLALRAHRGAWIDSEFRPASPDFLARFNRLPWHKWPEIAASTTWRALDDERAMIFERAPHGLWLAGKLAPSPIWEVNQIRVRLSLLQAVAMLPRAEVFTGPTRATGPLWFRFSGGYGCIAHDERLTLHSRALFAPARDCFTGAVTYHGPGIPGNFAAPPPPELPLEGWPPAEAD